MSVAVTIRDIPDEDRDLLASEAKQRGQSLQAYPRDVLHQEASFSRNSALVRRMEHELLKFGGVSEGAPTAAEAVQQARAQATGG